MEYSVGSLSDLISGSTTPNKKKVIKKKISSKNSETTQDISSDSLKLEESIESDFKDTTENSSTKKKNKRAKQKNKTPRTATEGDDKTEETTKLAGKKRKLANNDDNSSEPKKSKNSENAERRVFVKETKVKVEKFEEDPELLSRTIFVGNLPINLGRKQIKKLFTKFGSVETVRIRGVPVANPKMSKKVALIKKEFHPDRKSVYGYVRFQERESAIKATEANGMVYNDHHLRIHLCDVKDRVDENKAIFVGNLSFYAEEDDLWKIFESCGPISSVRIVRDGRTGIGKGFGYVNFENSDAVTLALEMENVKLKDRELRISICNINAAKKNVKKNKPKKITKPGKPKSPEKNTEIQEENENDVQNEEHTVVNESFQGTKIMQKKKNKPNKGLLLKKKKSEQIAPR